MPKRGCAGISNCWPRRARQSRRRHDLDAIARDPQVKEAARILVRAELPSTKVLRVNVTLPEDLLRRIDARTSNRSGFLAQAAERALSDTGK